MIHTNISRIGPRTIEQYLQKAKKQKQGRLQSGAADHNLDPYLFLRIQHSLRICTSSSRHPDTQPLPHRTQGDPDGQTLSLLLIIPIRILTRVSRILFESRALRPKFATVVRHNLQVYWPVVLYIFASSFTCWHRTSCLWFHLFRHP